MPRRKAPAPSRLGEGEREANTWNMGESSQSGAQPPPVRDTINDFLI